MACAEGFDVTQLGMAGLASMAEHLFGTDVAVGRLPEGLDGLAWQRDGRDVALLVGGPDGLAATLKAGADETLRLSDLTLPHAFVRVLLAEALYRAWTVTVNHPYHRQ